MEIDLQQQPSKKSLVLSKSDSDTSNSANEDSVTDFKDVVQKKVKTPAKKVV